MWTQETEAARGRAPSGETLETVDVVVVGGGPAGATAACDLALEGHGVVLLDRMGRIKPCGGAIPPRLVRDFEIPNELLVARINAARIIAPSAKTVVMPIDGGYVGMVDRDAFDEWLRDRAARHGAERRTGVFERLERDADGTAIVCYRDTSADADGAIRKLRARAVIGADGANSMVARHAMPEVPKAPFVFAYHEIIESPDGCLGFDGARCDVIYDGALSPDFYSWVFPHGKTTSVGTGTAVKGVSLRGAVGALRAANGMAGHRTVRREGAPIPLKPLRRWDNRRDVILAGDAAGVVAPASGEGIYYAMLSGRLAAEAVGEFLVLEDARALGQARRRFMRTHGKVFWVLGMMQRFWYKSDRRRERFVSICEDRDVQRLTWESYMNKTLVRAKPTTQARIFFKDLGHLLGVVSP